MKHGAMASAVGLMLGAALLACNGGGGDSPTPTPIITLTGTRAELDNLVNRMESLTFRVVYQVEGASGEELERLVITNLPPRTRVDTIPAGGTEAVSSFIGTGDGDLVISCENGPANWECHEIDDLGQSILRTAAPVTFFPRSALQTYQVTEIEGREIAGQQARCFEIDPPEEAAIEHCFTDDGILLYSSPTFGTVQAVELSRDVAEDAFEPPADPQ